jgi:hypothetical protein
MRWTGTIFKNVSSRQCMEFGQALVLICIGLALYYKNFHFAIAAFWAMLITMLIPRIFFPFAVIWFGIAGILNRISSWLVLHIVFFILVVPVGMIRKWRGKDTMKLKQFKKSRLSVMTIRDHLYEASDLTNTF